MGKDRGLSYWLTDLRAFFSSIEAEKFIWMMEDTLLIKEVDRNVLNTLYSLVDENIIRADLGGATCYRLGKLSKHKVKLYKEINDIRVISVSEGKTFMPVSVWNKKQFLRFSQDGQNPWQFEKESNKRSSRASEISICTNAKKGEIAVTYSEGVLHTKPDVIRLTSRWFPSNARLPKEVIEEMQKKHIIGPSLGKSQRDRYAKDDEYLGITEKFILML